MNQRKFWNEVANKKTFTIPFNMALFSEFIPKNSRVLDLGCGYGRIIKQLEKNGFTNTLSVVGIPRDLRLALDEIQASGKKVSAICASGDVNKWRVVELIPENYPEFADYKMLVPQSYLWPDFLKQSNLLAIVDK